MHFAVNDRQSVEFQWLHQLLNVRLRWRSRFVHWSRPWIVWRWQHGTWCTDSARERAYRYTQQCLSMWGCLAVEHRRGGRQCWRIYRRLPKCLLTSSLTLSSIQTAIYVATPAVPFWTSLTALDRHHSTPSASEWNAGPQKAIALFPAPSVRSTVSAQCQPPPCSNTWSV